MEPFLKALQGSYAYLLISQILVVSTLLLLLLTLIVRRIREQSKIVVATTLESKPETPALEVTAAASASAETIQISAQAPAAALLEQKADGSSSLSEQNAALTEQVKYLESKLLEYEILQEEIGTLSSLKMENEQLKQKVVALESQSSTKPDPKETPGESTDIATAPEKAAEEAQPLEPTLMADSIAKVVTTKLEKEEFKEPTPPIPPAEEADLKGLENLLQQIDQLTQSEAEGGAKTV